MNEFLEFDEINERDHQTYVDDQVDDIVHAMASKRICAYCHQPIKRHHKWFTDDFGMISHRDCDNPEYYPRG